jgi:hypothetical protein
MMYRDGRTLQARIEAIARMAVEMHLQAPIAQHPRGESPHQADDRRRRPAGGTGPEGQG